MNAILYSTEDVKKTDLKIFQDTTPIQFDCHDGIITFDIADLTTPTKLCILSNSPVVLHKFLFDEYFIIDGPDEPIEKYELMIEYPFFRTYHKIHTNKVYAND